MKNNRQVVTKERDTRDATLTDNLVYKESKTSCCIKREKDKLLHKESKTSCCIKREKDKLLHKEREIQVAAEREKKTSCCIKRETDKLLHEERDRQVVVQTGGLYIQRETSGFQHNKETGRLLT